MLIPLHPMFTFPPTLNFSSVFVNHWIRLHHRDDVISQITGNSIFCARTCSGQHERLHATSAFLAFEIGIHRWQVDSPHKGPVMQKCFHVTSFWYYGMQLYLHPYIHWSHESWTRNRLEAVKTTYRENESVPYSIQLMFVHKVRTYLIYIFH